MRKHTPASRLRRQAHEEWRPNRLAMAISAVLAGASPWAASLAQSDDDLPEIIVTATRRAEDIQDIPLNIAAIAGDQLATQGVTDISTLGRSVPGLFVINQGKRMSNQIIVRGLNVSNVTSQDVQGNDSGEIVSNYVGDIPFYVDMPLEDLERVEVLLGPQGTLYGAGTLGGAIRYLPRRPEFNVTSFSLRGSGYSLAESDDFGSRAGITVNLPLGDLYALRANLDYVDDAGFIDQPFVVRQAGVSDPEPDFTDPAVVAANLRRVEDVDDVEMYSGRIGFRARPEDGIDFNLTHYFQQMDSGGRTAHHVDAFGTGRYEAAHRFLEPNSRDNRMTALEITADLGFAELTSATGYTRFKETGRRDQTDLLLTLEYSYEAFPTFSAFTREYADEKRLSQEVRLVSTDAGPWNWIGGFFYNDYESFNESKEFTPVYDDYLASFFGGSGRPDDLEYFSQGTEDLVEKALFGELGYDLTERWQVTIGARYYKYTYITFAGYDVPMFNTAIGVYAPDETNLVLEEASQKDSGTLFKFNTSYQFTPDLMGYLTVSEGYRIGASNGIAPCQLPLDPNVPTVCALPDELQYTPDSTVNYEIGVRSQWLGGALTLNGSIFYIDWTDPQLEGTTANGNLPITRNGKGAESRGVELSFNAQVSDRLALRGSYAHSEAKLTATAPNLLRVYIPPGFGPKDPALYINGENGDRLPGSPEDQATLFADYTMPVGANWELTFNYGLAMVGDIITRTGLRAGGETLPGYTVHNAGVTLRGDVWTLGLYGINVFNKYAETGTRSRREFIQTLADENGDPVRVRSYYRDVLRPREVGLRFTYDFDL